MTDNSFVPEDYLDKRAARRTNLICVTLFIVVMGAVVGAYFFTDKQRVDVRGELADVNERVAEAGRRLEQLDQLQKSKDQMLRKAKITGTLVERIPRSLLLSQLINNMPTTLSLLELELSTEVIQYKSNAPRTAMDKAKQKADAKSKNEPDLPDPKATRMTLLITGVARTDVEVAQFMNDLTKLPLFASVNLGFSEEIKIQDEPMRKFKIEAAIEQAIDLERFEPLMVKRLKQNPMGNTIAIDSEGRFIAPSENPNIKNAADKTRPTLKD